MPNQCVHCSEIFGDGAGEILTGCSKCGSKFFFYLSAEKLNKLKNSNEVDVELSSIEKKQIEEDVRDIVGIEDEDAPVVLDFESVKITQPGKYILDIPNLFSKERPLIYKLEDGKYVIDLSSLKVPKDAN
jgi:predicted  nucleic acid-binding Zn-ribbon protein